MNGCHKGKTTDCEGGMVKLNYKLPYKREIIQMTRKHPQTDIEWQATLDSQNGNNSENKKKKIFRPSDYIRNFLQLWINRQ